MSSLRPLFLSTWGIFALALVPSLASAQIYTESVTSSWRSGFGGSRFTVGVSGYGGYYGRPGWGRYPHYGYYPDYGYPGVYAPQYYGPTYPYGFNGSYGPYSIYGPLILPGNSLFGIGALPAGTTPYDFPRAPTTTIIQVAPQQPVQPAGGVAPQGGAPVQKPVAPAVKADDGNELVLRKLTPEAKERALKYLDLGDKRFQEQKYLSAYQQYQNGRNAAPAYGEVHFRRGWALIAMKDYPRAAEAFRLGLQLDPNWPRSAFTLTDLYADNKILKTAHLDALAQAAREKRQDSDLTLVLGIFLYFDGQIERSQTFFEQAAAAGADAQFLIPFFPEDEPAPIPAPQAEVPPPPGPAPRPEGPVAGGEET